MKLRQHLPPIRNQKSSFITPLFSPSRILLVPFNSVGDPEDAWQHDYIKLLTLNPDYDPIVVAPHEGPEMVVVGEWAS